MAIEIIRNKTGAEWLRSTMSLENREQREMGLKKPEEVEIPFTFNPRHVVNYYQHEWEDDHKWDRTMIEFSHGGSVSIGCKVKEFETVFLNLNM